VTVLAILGCLRNWRTSFPWLLSATLALPISAAVAVPGLVLPPFFLVALVLSGLLAWEWMSGKIALFAWRGSPLLIAFLGWCVLITVAGPVVFAGATVLNNVDGGLVGATTLAYASSNVAQLAYLGISGLIICFFASGRPLSIHILLPGLVGCMSLSFWRLLADKLGVYFPAGLVDSSSYVYIDINNAESYRLRGIFTEPSTLAHYATAAFALSLVMLYVSGNRLRLVYLGLAVVSAINLVFAHSGTALVGGAVVLAVTVVFVAVRASRTGRGLWALSISTCVASIVVLISFGPIQRYATELFSDKVSSASFDGRTLSDTFSLQLFLDSFGLGVGLGSNKPSSLWPMMLSCVGVVGVVLFVVLVGYLVWPTLTQPHWLGAGIVVTSMLVTKSVAGSFLSEPLLMLALAVCAYAGAERARGRVAQPPEPEAAARASSPARSRDSRMAGAMARE